jgi:hypothetical protein
MMPIRASIVGPPFVATRIKACIAACHSGASCSAFGSFMMYLPASSSVTSSRPPGSGIGSSNGRFQPPLGTRPPIMRQPLTTIEASVFLGGPIALIAPRLKIRLGAVRQKHAPCGLEVGPRLVERSRGAALMFAGMGSRIKSAAPAPTDRCRLDCPSGARSRRQAKLRYRKSPLISRSDKAQMMPLENPNRDKVKPSDLLVFSGRLCCAFLPCLLLQRPRNRAKIRFLGWSK